MVKDQVMKLTYYVRRVYNNYFYRFILLSIFLYLLWFCLYDLWLRDQKVLDDKLSLFTSISAVSVLKLIGLSATYRIDEWGLSFFYINGLRMLQMVPACNGQVLYALFAGFIIASPGQWRRKAFFIAAGVVIIFIVNTLRVAGLCLIQYVNPKLLAFNHKYTFVVIVYGVVFFLWVIWVRKFMVIKSNSA